MFAAVCRAIDHHRPSAAWLTRVDLAAPARRGVSTGKAGSPTRCPLTLGLGTVLLMSSIDMLFVQGLFADTRPDGASTAERC